MPPDTNREIGQRIRARRELRRITQADLARELERGQGTIAKYESGEVVLRPEQILVIANLLKVSVSYLFGEDDADLLASAAALGDLSKLTPDETTAIVLLIKSLTNGR